MPSMPEFSVVVASGEPKVMAIFGALDIKHAEDLTSVGLLTIQSLNGNHGPLVLDLAGVPFMDSTGLGALIAIRNAANARGRDVRLRAVRPRIAKVLGVTGLSDEFDVAPPDDEHD